MNAHCWLKARRHAPATRWDGYMYRWAECGGCGRRYTTHALRATGPSA